MKVHEPVLEEWLFKTLFLWSLHFVEIFQFVFICRWVLDFWVVADIFLSNENTTVLRKWKANSTCNQSMWLYIEFTQVVGVGT